MHKMSPNGPEHITTRIKIMKDRNLSIILNPGHFMDMNQAYTEEMGHSLLAAAETDPTEAYRYIRRAIGMSAAQNAVNVIHGDIVVDAMVHGIESTRSYAEETILTIMPAEYEGPRIVRVAIESIDIGGHIDVSEPHQMLELKIKPTDLAA